MRLTAFSRPLALAGLLSLFVLLVGPLPLSLAEDEPAPQPVVEVQVTIQPLPIELDLQALLFDDPGQALQDPVWTIAAQPGQRVVYLPLKIGKVDHKAELSRCPIKPRAARFIGYVIPAPTQTDSTINEAALDVDKLIDAGTDELQAMLFAPVDRLIEGGPDGEAQQQEEQEPDTELQAVPESAPRLAREVVLHPDGTVQWEMDRALPGATLKPASEQNLYPYKIDSRLVAEKEPPRPERITRNDGEDSRAYALRKREAQVKQRADQQAFRDLRNSIRDLPDEFREPAPKIIYAVYSFNETDRLSLQGPAPLPWALKDDEHDKLKSLAQGGGTAEGDADAALSVIKDAAKTHVYSARGAAFAALRGGLASKVEIDDTGYQLIVDLLNGKDPVARRVALYGVARAQPASIASAQLLGIAGKNAVADAERELLKFSELRQLFEIEIGNPESVELLVTKVNAALADPQGPSPASVIHEVLSAVGRGSEGGFGGSTIPQSSVDAMVQGLSLDALSKEQLQTVIKIVIGKAPTSVIASGWLDAQLLGSKDAARIHQALELLKTTQAAVADAPGPGEEPAPTTIPIASKDHGMIRAISGSDPLLRARAWPVLARFHLVKAMQEEGTPTEAPGEGNEQLTELFELVMAKALAEKQTPATIVAFLTNPHDQELGDQAPGRMVELLLEPGVDAAVKRLVADELLGTEGRYGSAFGALKSSDQAVAATALYQAMDREPPLSVGLLANPDRSTLPWFTSEMSEGRLPDSRQWADQAGGPANGGEQKLLGLAGSGDAGVASSAAAALVVNAGGDTKDETDFAQTVGLMDSRDPESVKKAWIEFKTKLHTRIFDEAQGSYRLVATLTEAVEPEVLPEPGELVEEGEDTEKPEPVVKRYELGLVDLRAAGATVSLSVEGVKLSVSPDVLGIRIDSVDSLKALESADLKQLPMDQLNGPIDLRPKDDGSWSGQIQLPDTRVVGVILELAA